MSIMNWSIPLVSILVGCTGDKAATSAPASPDPSAPVADVEPSDAAVNAEALLRRYADAANRGDEAGVRDCFSTTATFDRAGTVFVGRESIMRDFLIPDVLRASGHYEVLTVTRNVISARVEFKFSSRTEREHFTYEAWVSDGAIVRVVGRYV